MSPLNSQTRRHMPHSRFGGIVRCLTLWQIDNSTRHATNEHHASWCLAGNQMLGDCYSKEIGAEDIDIEETAHVVNGIFQSGNVLSKACGGNKVVDFAVCFENFVDGDVYPFFVWDVWVMCCYFGDTALCISEKGVDREWGIQLLLCVWIFHFEIEGQIFCLSCCCLLWERVRIKVREFN